MRIQRPSEIVAPYTPEVPGTDEPSQTSPTGGPSPFARLLKGFGRELDRGESLTADAIRGGGGAGGLSPGALLALQAGIYRYVEAVDLVTKLVDRATQAVKTTLQNQ